MMDDPEATRKARIALLCEEIDAIHFANVTYWQQTVHTVDAEAEYQSSQDRLEEIRRELAELTK
jgi:hypothetical protein